MINTLLIPRGIGIAIRRYQFLSHTAGNSTGVKYLYQKIKNIYNSDSKISAILCYETEPITKVAIRTPFYHILGTTTEYFHGNYINNNGKMEPLLFSCYHDYINTTVDREYYQYVINYLFNHVDIQFNDL